MASKRTTVPALVLKSYDTEIDKITPITDTSLLIGRGPDASFKLRHKTVSRIQCLIKKSGINWAITSLGSRPTSLNDIPLDKASPTSLKCSDLIELPGQILFEFKCSPDQNGRCCEDSELLSPIIHSNDSIDLEKPTSTPSTSAYNSFQNSLSTEKQSADSSVCIVEEIQPFKADDSFNINPISMEMESMKSSSLSSSNLGLHLEIDHLTEMILMYANHLEQNESLESDSNDHSRLIDELNVRLECAVSIEKYGIDESCQAHERNGNINSLMEVIKKLSSILDKKRNDITSGIEGVSGESINENFERLFLAVDLMLMSKAKAVVNVLNKLPNRLITEQSNDYSSLNLGSRTSRVCSCKQQIRKISNRKRKAPITAGIENVDGNESDLKEKVKWQETKIQYLQMKLKEREGVANELEAAKEENDVLVNKISEMKRTLADKEVMELEFKYLQESVKYKEEDKRSKDLLQERITSQETEITNLKTENAKLLVDIEQMKYEKTDLLDKNRKLEEKCQSLAAGSCKGDFADEEFCCDAVREVKSSLVELLEREFNCSICSEILIEPTVTNCNHVFCSYCLNEWKKTKRECPFCRSIVTKECRAVIIDEYISCFLKLVAEKMLPERLQLIEERKAPSVEPPPAKRSRARANRTITPRRGRNPRTLQNPPNPHAMPIDPVSGFPENFLDNMALRMFLMRSAYHD